VARRGLAKQARLPDFFIEALFAKSNCDRPSGIYCACSFRSSTARGLQGCEPMAGWQATTLLSSLGSGPTARWLGVNLFWDRPTFSLWRAFSHPPG
jgi:hypothetical protein